MTIIPSYVLYSILWYLIFIAYVVTSIFLWLLPMNIKYQGWYRYTVQFARGLGQQAVISIEIAPTIISVNENAIMKNLF